MHHPLPEDFLQSRFLQKRISLPSQRIVVEIEI